MKFCMKDYSISPFTMLILIKTERESNTRSTAITLTKRPGRLNLNYGAPAFLSIFFAYNSPNNLYNL